MKFKDIKWEDLDKKLLPEVIKEMNRKLSKLETNIFSTPKVITKIDQEDRENVAVHWTGTTHEGVEYFGRTYFDDHYTIIEMTQGVYYDDDGLGFVDPYDQ